MLMRNQHGRGRGGVSADPHLRIGFPCPDSGPRQDFPVARGASEERRRATVDSPRHHLEPQSETAEACCSTRPYCLLPPSQERRMERIHIRPSATSVWLRLVIGDRFPPGMDEPRETTGRIIGQLLAT